MIGLLCIFKYTGFLAEGFQFLFGVPKKIPEIVLPIGISFYTFQLLSYVVDVYRGEVEAQKSFWVLLLYASLFHQCVAGPIVRYSTVAMELEHRRARMSEVAEGAWRFSAGLAKKAILANGCALVADTFLPMEGAALGHMPVLAIWVGILAYTLQIYLDFSAYSDMAIGMGLMVGLHYQENFNYPYIAGSVQEFWRRWHISLSSFFSGLCVHTSGRKPKRGAEDHKESAYRLGFDRAVAWRGLELCVVGPVFFLLFSDGAGVEAA